MTITNLSEEHVNQLISFQKNEITEYYLYQKIAKKVKNEQNRTLLLEIANDEKRHYDFWKQYTHTDVKPNRWAIFKFYWIIRLLGLTFGIKLMEKGEAGAQIAYKEACSYIPDARKVVEDEDAHEAELINMIEEKKLDHVGSIVLGLNDALVELTGVLAGLTFALQNTKLIALAGLITGIAASFSMAASEYLSKRAEDENADALVSSLYTGAAYIITVVLLILPYLLISNFFISLGATLVIAVLIIFLFNYYISVAKDLNFRRRFTEMAVISLGVAALSFGIGFVIRQFLGVEV